MPEFTVKGGDKTFRRKNLYMPCIISARTDEMSEDELVAIYKATYWADNIAASEWPVVLRHDDASKANRSRLKKKGAGWIMALARIAVINPELFKAMCDQARTMYADQVEDDFPWTSMIPALMGEDWDVVTREDDEGAA
jgi:hypothetical protein